MCGIAGASRLTPITRAMLPFLMWEMEDRGKDSFGATDGYEIYKALGHVTTGWPGLVAAIERWDRGIFHTRNGTVGAATIPNAHPFVVDCISGDIVDSMEVPAGAIVGIHNGHISNHDELAKKHNRTGYSVDSMHVLGHLALGLDVDEIRGWGAVAWYTRDQGFAELNLTRFNMDALHIVQLKSGEVVFCSTRDPIERSIKMVGAEVEKWYLVQGDKHYVVQTHSETGMDELRVLGDLKFGFRHTTSSASSSVAGYVSRSYGVASSWNNSESVSSSSRLLPFDQIGRKSRDKDLCAHCESNHVNRRKSLVCSACLTMILGEVIPRKEKEDVAVL